MASSVELIVYACPTGSLAEQVVQYFAHSREHFGPNSAHAYPPHITLTGFFHDEAAAIPAYRAALAAAYRAHPSGAVTITELYTSAEFHGLLIVAPWLETLTAAFAAFAPSTTRRDELRVKSNLHLSLAYGFAPVDGLALGELALRSIDPAAPVGWELCLYERHPGARWSTHWRAPLAAE